jgi:hypothetical protein
MPPLPNPKQELFCRKLVEGKSKAKAYEEAGYNPNRGNAVRLMNANESVKQRYLELFKDTIPQVKWTREEVNHQLTDLLLQAKEQKNLAIAAKLVDSIARINGLVINRTESGKAGEFEALSDSELIELIATPLGEALSNGIESEDSD